MTGSSQKPHGKIDEKFRFSDMGGPGLSLTWPESKIKNKAEPGWLMCYSCVSCVRVEMLVPTVAVYTLFLIACSVAIYSTFGHFRPCGFID